MMRHSAFLRYEGLHNNQGLSWHGPCCPPSRCWSGQFGPTGGWMHGTAAVNETQMQAAVAVENQTTR